jgi:iron complex outermembrane receptor protein
LSTGLSLSVFVNNAFDQRYANGVNGIARDTLGTSFSSITAPRVWGLEIGYDF